MTVVSIKQDGGCEGLPWQFSDYDTVLPLQGTQVQFLIWELRHRMPAKAAKKKKNDSGCESFSTVCGLIV